MRYNDSCIYLKNRVSIKFDLNAVLNEKKGVVLDCIDS